MQTFSLAAYKSGEDVAAATTKLTWPGSLPVDQRITSEIGWVGDSSLMIKEVDRAARKGSVVIFQDGQHEGQVVRVLGKDGEESDGGWIDHVGLTWRSCWYSSLTVPGPERCPGQSASGGIH